MSIEKLDMKTPNKTNENFVKLQELFPNAVTETIDENGELIRAIDKDVLMQEISAVVVEGKEERYQFTWPDKRKSILTANTPINKTLRPCKDESVHFDTTENLYIEGDNLEALKLLQESYLGKVKMIYIDPPYNTGNDFVYKDKFAIDSQEWAEISGDYDEDGNRLFKNLDSNGRFHTDWLNMIYPRLKLARDLLSDDGAIFIHIDEYEVYNMQKLCNEVFGEGNELGTIIWDKRNPKGTTVGVAYQHESIIVFCKNKLAFADNNFSKNKENATAMINKVNSLVIKNNGVTEAVKKEYKEWLKTKKSELSGGELAYNSIDFTGRIYRVVSMAAPDKPETRSHRPLIHPITKMPCPTPSKGWRFIDATMDELLLKDKIEFGIDHTTQPNQKYFLDENLEETVSSLIYFGGSDVSTEFHFDNPKPTYIAEKIIKNLCKGSDDIILDFFSGSATTAHAVMQLNAQDGGNRKFIMVQVNELTYDGKKEKYTNSNGKEKERYIIDKETGYPIINKDSEARKAGYWTIPQIGKERIRRAGAKIVEENKNNENIKNLDIGFRVLKVDSSNMEDLYYTPNETKQEDLFATNIKEDRGSLDLLFQVLLDSGVELSLLIKVEKIQNKEVFIVGDGELIACFEDSIDEELIKQIAKKEDVLKVVFKDSSFSSDSARINAVQLFKQYAPNVTIKVI